MTHSCFSAHYLYDLSDLHPSIQATVNPCHGTGLAHVTKILQGDSGASINKFINMCAIVK